MRRVLQSRSTVAVVLCLLLLGTLLVFVRFDLGKTCHLLLRGERAIGNAEAVDDAQWVVRFRTADGSIIRRRFDAVTWHPSPTPEILYDARRPSRFVMRGEANGAMVLFGCLLLGTCVLLANELRRYVMLRRDGRPSRLRK